MGTGELVRASRDGDKYHYFWAGRRALRLLEPTGDLKVLGVEGLPEGEEIAGEEVVDVAEYFGGKDAMSCARVRYSQLKHSTLRDSVPITASELKNTLEKFAAIYRDAKAEGWSEKLEFAFVANRTLNEKVATSLSEMSGESASFTYPAEVRLLRRYMGFGSATGDEAEFCKCLAIEDSGPGLVQMEQMLRSELQQFLPGGGTGTELAQVTERISRCATSLSEQTLEKADILVALRTTEEELFPAPAAILAPDHIVRTKDVVDVGQHLLTGATNKFLVTAIGGMGKSVLASALQGELPQGSLTIVYDCFAGGDYRKITSQRHEHRTAFTQISNELAAAGMCAPLIPTQATEAQYTHVLMRRVRDAADQLKQIQADALLVVVIDAADNAAMAAQELDRRTFVTDLLRENWPSNARLVELSRPERAHLLDIPHNSVTTIRMAGFREDETLQHVRSRFPGTTEPESAEFHALSDSNPRVQAMAIEGKDTIAETLASLAIVRNRSGEDTLDDLLEQQVATVAEQGQLLPDELTRLCEALAVLHPPIPLADLAAITGLHADAIRSFAVALGRGLYATDSSLQFRDEPTETWFRKAHGLTGAQLKSFVHTIAPLAQTSPYVAVTMPQLLFEAELVDELVDLALSDAGLPGDAEGLQAQEISRSRARFALTAMLRAGRLKDAALLAIKAGALTSGHSRKLKMFRTHTDLAARFLGPDAVDALCSGRELAEDWPGSSLHVEAAMYSYIDQFQNIARSRSRSAFNNFVAITRMPDDDHGRLWMNITANAVADLAMAVTNTEGVNGGMKFLARWRNKRFVHKVAAKLFARLADAGRYEELATFVNVGARHKRVQLAVAETMFDYNIIPPAQTTRDLAKMLTGRKRRFKPMDGLPYSDPDLRGVAWTLVHGVRSGVLTESEAIAILDTHLPDRLPDGIGSPYRRGRGPADLLLSYALRARLTGNSLKLEDVASGEILAKIRKLDHSSDRTAREFAANIPGLLAWAECWLAAILGQNLDGASKDIEKLIKNDLPTASDYNTPSVLLNTIAELATRMLALVQGKNDLIAALNGWHSTEDKYLGKSRITVASIASRSPGLETFGISVAMRGVDAAQRDRVEADMRVDTLVDLARAVLVASESEARAIFDCAMEEAEQVGDDLYARWRALTKTSQALAGGTEPERAYRLYQIGEELERAADILGVTELGTLIRAMHEPTYFALASRSRDRRTIDFRKFLKPAFESATATKLNRTELLALYAFDLGAEWAPVVGGLSDELHTRAWNVFEDFTRIELSGDDAALSGNENWQLIGDGETQPAVSIEDQFRDSDFTSDATWNEALTEVPWPEEKRKALVGFAFSKHPTHRADVLDAFCASTIARESDFAIVASVAAEHAQTLGLKSALRRLGEVFARRFAREICTRQFGDEALETVASATGHPVATLTMIGFQELGRSAHELAYDGYFLLAAHIANELGTEETGEIFDSLAGLFDDLASPHDSSDGPFTDQKTPPSDLAACMAGFIWTALGDMSIEVRWQAAHALLLLVRLGCEDVITALVNFATGTQHAAAFLDARLPFYELHAKMWLLLSLARAAQEPNAKMLTGFSDWLVSVVDGPPHASNQVLAQQTLATLSNAGVLAGDYANALEKKTTASWVEADYNARSQRPNPLATIHPGKEVELERERFFYDYERYWCSDLAEAFGTTNADVARQAARAARGLNGYAHFAANEDPRASLDVYDRERYGPDHGSWPDEERLSFYLAIHTLLAVGAELAQSATAYKEPDYEQDSYTEWLAQFLPRRTDGRWLADRRDAPPTPTPESTIPQTGYGSTAVKDAWPWSLSNGDFAAMIGIGADWVTVWADSDAARGDLDEDTFVRSALVPRETAASLLIAQQTSRLGPHATHFPTDDDHTDRPGRYPFQLVPWLNLQRRHGGIDDRDQRAGGIAFPAARPGLMLVERFGLTADDDWREWSAGGMRVFRSRLWTTLRQPVRDRETGGHGEKLEVSHGFLTEMLAELDMSLAVQAGIRRSTHRSYDERKGTDRNGFDWIEWSGKIFVVDPGGKWREY